MNLIPFDIEKAKAGAKVVTRIEEPFHPLTFFARGDYPILGHIGDSDVVYSWGINGSFLVLKDSSVGIRRGAGS